MSKSMTSRRPCSSVRSYKLRVKFVFFGKLLNFHVIIFVDNTQAMRKNIKPFYWDLDLVDFRIYFVVNHKTALKFGHNIIFELSRSVLTLLSCSSLTLWALLCGITHIL
jgi:Ni,Fe-hydrogenase I cytochrome b subunit